jgi:hypothetical protein
MLSESDEGHSRNSLCAFYLIYTFFVRLFVCEFESRPGQGIQHYVIKFVSDLRHVGGFLRVLRFPPPISVYVQQDIMAHTVKVTINQGNLSLLY